MNELTKCDKCNQELVIGKDNIFEINFDDVSGDIHEMTLCYLCYKKLWINDIAETENG